MKKALGTELLEVCTLYLWILLLPIHLLSRAEAYDNDHFTVVAQRSMPGGLEQISLEFTASEVQFMANSNLFFRDRGKANLGRFKCAMTEVLATRKRELAKVKIRMDRSSTRVHGASGGYLSPHRTRFFLAGHELNEGAPYRETVIGILTSAWRIADWVPVDAVEIKLNTATSLLNLKYGGKSAKTEEISTKAAKCNLSAEADLRCSIREYGTVYLNKDKARFTGKK